jgi:hypothetical protein
MRHARKYEGRTRPNGVIDFDEVLLDSCAPRVRAELMVEAELLAGVFAPTREAVVLERMAAQLSAGDRDAEMDRAHARRLAAALKRLARAA